MILLSESEMEQLENYGDGKGRKEMILPGLAQDMLALFNDGCERRERGNLLHIQHIILTLWYLLNLLYDEIKQISFPPTTGALRLFTHIFFFFALFYIYISFL